VVRLLLCLRAQCVTGSLVGDGHRQ
jgi:hypothetical protein